MLISLSSMANFWGRLIAAQQTTLLYCCLLDIPRRWGRMRRLCSLSRAIVQDGLGAAVLLGAPAHAALAAGPYPTGSSGFDISYPQCGSPQPSGSFAIIGVTHGRAFSRNDCCAAEYQQAVAA